MHRNTALSLRLSLISFIISLIISPLSFGRQKQDSFLKIFQGYDHPAIRIADSLYFFEEIDQSIAAYRKAEKYFEARNDWQGMIYCNNMLAELYANRRYNKTEASNYIDKAYQILKPHLNEDQLLKADFYLINGTILSNSDSGQYLIYKALKIYLSKLGPKSFSVGEAYFDLGQSLNHKVWEFDSSNTCMELSRKIFEDYCPPNDIRIFRTYYYQASNFHLVYDFNNAFLYLQQILGQIMQDSIKNTGNIQVCRVFQGNCYSDLMDYKKALHYYNLSVPYYKQRYGEHSELCLMYLNICECYLNQHDLVNGSKYLNMAINIYKNSHLSDVNALSQMNFDHSRYLILNGQYEEANRYLKKSLQLTRDNFSDNYHRISDILELFSLRFNEMGRYDSALYYSQQAMMTLDTTFNDPDYKANPKINFQQERVRLYDFLSLKARIFTNLYNHGNHNLDDLKQALHIYTLIDALGDQMRNSGIPEESQILLASLFQTGIEAGINCAQELYYQTADSEYFDVALKFMEKSKYMQLFKNAHIAQRSNKIKVPAEYLKTYDSLNLQLSTLDQEIDFENQRDIKDFRKISNLNTSRLELVAKRKEFTEKMNSRYPNFFYVDFDSLTTKSSDIEAYIRNNNQLFIEYYLGEKNLYSIAISQKYKAIFKVPADSLLKKSIDQYLKKVQENSSDATLNDFEIFSRNSYSLYNKLLEPVLEKLNYNQTGSLLIVPDGELAQIPFGAFIREMPEKINGNYAGLHYLIRDYLIRYLYSANLLLKNINHEKPAKNNMLAFSYTGIEELAHSNERGLGRNELPGTALEMSAIKKVMKGRNRYFEDNQATEHNFKAYAPGFRIIHLGVHGQADLNNPLNSKLIFKTGQDSTDDGTLYVYELYDLDLHHTELSVLSACETGIGKEYHGEGVFSVARGFVYAGCPAVIMSLWKVDDIQSAKIMEEFYRLLNKGDKTAEALRASKLHFLESAESHQAHPSNWAAFVMLGQNEALTHKPTINYYIAVVGVFLIIFLSFILFKKRYFKT